MNVEPNPGAKTQVNALAAASRFRSKKEGFQFLVTDCETYLPDDHEGGTTYFLKQLITGEKKRKDPSSSY